MRSPIVTLSAGLPFAYLNTFWKHYTCHFLWLILICNLVNLILGWPHWQSATGEMHQAWTALRVSGQLTNGLGQFHWHLQLASCFIRTSSTLPRITNGNKELLHVNTGGKMDETQNERLRENGNQFPLVFILFVRPRMNFRGLPVCP